MEFFGTGYSTMTVKLRQIFFSLVLFPMLAAPAFSQPTTRTEEIEQIGGTRWRDSGRNNNPRWSTK